MTEFLPPRGKNPENKWYPLIKSKFDELVAAGVDSREALNLAATWGRECLEEHISDMRENL